MRVHEAGDNVASPKSITRASDGTGRLLPASTILFPVR